MVMILAPVPILSQGEGSLCPPVGPLSGKTVGLRLDHMWVSWDYVTDEWAKMLQKDGADPVLWRAPIGKGDKEMLESADELQEFLHEVDVAIVGLCTCGSCTMWAVHDGVAALNAGIPTVVVCTEHFEPLARTLASQQGYPSIRVEVLPYPLQGRPEGEIREIARAHYESLLEAMGTVR